MHHQWYSVLMHVCQLCMHDCVITKYNLFCYGCDHRHGALSQFFLFQAYPRVEQAL